MIRNPGLLSGALSLASRYLNGVLKMTEFKKGSTEKQGCKNDTVSVKWKPPRLGALLSLLSLSTACSWLDCRPSPDPPAQGDRTRGFLLGGQS